MLLGWRLVSRVVWRSCLNNWPLDQTWEAKMDVVEREGYYRLWKKAVAKTFDWV
jgi:glycerol kinase